MTRLGSSISERSTCVSSALAQLTKPIVSCDTNSCCLVVTDHLMPGMNGTDLAQEMRAIRPGLPILVVAGYAEVDGIAPDLPRLTKPFRNAELAASLSALVPDDRELSAQS